MIGTSIINELNYVNTRMIMTSLTPLLRKKCPYSELFWSAFSCIWTEYEERRRVTPNNGHFLRSAYIEVG